MVVRELMPTAEAVSVVHSREQRIGISISIVKTKLGMLGDGAVLYRRPVARLKALPSDFVVRELSLLYNDGKPLELEELPSAEDSSAKRNAPRSKRSHTAELATEAPSHTLSEEVLEELESRFSSFLTTEELKTFMESLRGGADTLTIRSTLTKAQRTQIHHSVRELLGGLFVSRAEGDLLVISKATESTKRADERRLNPLSKQRFLHFTLYKENMDGNLALREVASYIKTPLRSILFSGTKDKRAVTLQRVAVRGLSPDRLSGLNNRSFGMGRKLKVCGFKMMDIGLRLGDAVGNQFLVVLRLMPGDEEIGADALRVVEDIVRREGVVNYFGTQRFGTTEVLTSDVGIELLSGNFEQALQLVFRSKSFVEPKMIPVKEAVERGSFEEALKLVPYYCFQERDMLEHLVRFPNDFLGSFSRISRTMAMMYFHAVQSLIWNQMASKRLAFSLEPQVGDLVLKCVHTQLLKCLRELGSFEEVDHLMDNEMQHKDEGLPEVVQLSDEDLASGIFRLHHVLLTVPGPDEHLLYPGVEVCNRKAYIATLHETGAEDLMNGSNSLVKSFHFHGAYRRLVVRPKDFKMRLHGPTVVDEPIVPTDLEVLSGHREVMSTGTRNIPHEGGSAPSMCQCILVEFSLPPGSYATCVLRELCDCCTEGHHDRASPVAGNAVGHTQDVSPVEACVAQF
uniref:TRUD domain-containing protein n=1 Tax=Trypanosoma congolense (strain IL3000) TaxID=1068625 RepID=G0UX90_TRYCI|nr:conserved hypothetical protein [Trypanosoma congolense IL3000]